MDGEAPELPRNFRLKAAIACDSVLRLMRLATDASGGDLEAYMVYLAVVSASHGAILRERLRRIPHGPDSPVSDDERQPVSRRAIAHSVGLARETVRRKVSALIEAGHLKERAGGVIPAGPVIERWRNGAFAAEVIKEFERVCAELNRTDVASERRG
jgi:hypothetical protein